ncbi:hypothetical protein FB451DRAFT_1167161 [Mycena latifolia]|nr:hypothetical protein FB451DRAFT_1167161 [Mycena latifolia]
MTLQMCQDLITEFTDSAGLKKSYTTHSFRRGGAQYCSMFAPLGKRWSLSIIRWWCGWASGEHVNTLMKYLLDSLQSYETGHDDTYTLHCISLATGVCSITGAPQAGTPSNQSHQAQDEPSLPQTSIPISERVAIIPGVVIPDLKKGDSAWLEGIRQWEHGDPANDLKPLRDWPHAWYTEGMRKITGTKRSQHKLIFNEYERLGCSKSEFIKADPGDTHKRISKLLLAIRNNNKARGVTVGRRR